MADTILPNMTTEDRTANLTSQLNQADFDVLQREALVAEFEGLEFDDTKRPDLVARRGEANLLLQRSKKRQSCWKGVFDSAQAESAASTSLAESNIAA